MRWQIVISFLCCSLLVAVISWIKTHKQKLRTSTDYFLGGRSLGFIVVGGSLFLTNISANQFIGENESVYINNMSVMAWGMTSIFAMLIVSEFFLPIYLRIGAITTPDFLAVRFDSATKKIVSVIFLASYIISLIPAVLYGGAVAFEGMFHIQEMLRISYWETIWFLVIAIGITGGLYSLLGGLKAISISDTVLGLGLLIGGLLLPYYGFKYLGHGNVHEGLNVVLSSKQSHLNSIGSKEDAVPLSTLFTGMLLINLYYWGMEQYIMQQVLASKNLAEGQKGIALACFYKLVSPLLLNVPGLIAVHIYANLNNTASVFPTLAGDVLPPLFTGLIAALVFGAALSTFSAGINSVGTLFIMNLYKPWVEAKGKNSSEKQLLKVGKRFQFAVILIGILIAPFIIFSSGGFYTYIQKVSSFFSVPVFTILIVGFTTKRVPPIAAKVGALFFIIAYSITQFVVDTGIHYLHMVAILFVVTVLLMLLMGKLWPMPVPYNRTMQPTGSVDLKPWKHRYIFGIILIVLMVLTFVIFSPVGLAK